jgi:hypothetical protein
MTNEQLDTHLDAILRAAGSALRHYTLDKSKTDMREALRAALAAAAQIALDPSVSAEARMLIDRGREAIGTKDLCHEVERALAEMSGCNYNSAAERLRRALEIGFLPVTAGT